MASHYLAGKESLKEKNYFVIQLVELVQIVFHLFFWRDKVQVSNISMVLAHKLALKIRLKYLKWFLSFSPNYYIA
jgi:hypothetical protein